VQGVDVIEQPTETLQDRLQVGGALRLIR